MRTVRLPSGEAVPALGQGTWRMAQRPERRVDEIAALRRGLDLGLTLIDTAEVYADGRSEELVAEAIAGRRDEVFLVSKVAPSNATRESTVAACEGSLRRLRTDRLDLYLLHWPSRVPLAATIEAFTELLEAGKVRHWGVSNFDVAGLEEVLALPGGQAVTTDQVPYSLERREIEAGLLPWCRSRGVPVMAYSPFEQGRLAAQRALAEIAARWGATPAQVALAWTLRLEGVISIPKAGTTAHVEENRAALDLELPEEELRELDVRFPPLRGRRR